MDDSSNAVTKLEKMLDDVETHLSAAIDNLLERLYGGDGDDVVDPECQALLSEVDNLFKDLTIDEKPPPDAFDQTHLGNDALMDVASHALEKVKALPDGKQKSALTAVLEAATVLSPQEWTLLRVWDALEFEDEHSDVTTMGLEGRGDFSVEQTDVLQSGFRKELEARLEDMKQSRVELERLYAKRVDDGLIDEPENAEYKESCMKAMRSAEAAFNSYSGSDPTKPKSKAKPNKQPEEPNVVQSLGTLYSEGAELQSGQVVKYAVTELKGPLLKLPAFEMQMVKWDGMHTVNLGVDLWVVASVMKKLFEYDVFGGTQMDESDRYLIAYDLFKRWSRENKVWNLMFQNEF
eukprot:s1851_g17.t1